MVPSFQVEMASPFGSVLKDHNSRRDRWRDSNPSPNPKPQCNFQRNLKELVRDHLHSCISISPRASNPEPDENSNHHHHHRQSSCCFGGGNNNHHHRWAAQKEAEMVTTIESLRPQQSEICSIDLSVSSLVQRWRGFEVDAKHNNPNNNNNNVGNNVNAEVKVSRTDSGASTCESTVTTATTTAAEDGGESPEAEEEGGERERIRVADIVRKWACDERGVKGSNIQDQQLPLGACLARLRMGMDSGGGGVNMVCSPRIRGRQAIADLFMRIERERSKEIELLGFRHAVTKFPQRGRIQSLLRLKLLRREVSQYEQPPSRVEGSSRCQTASAITSLRERFSATTDHDSANMRSTTRDTPSSNQHTETPSTSKKPSENIRNNSPIEITNNNEGEETFPTSNPLNSHHKESHREPHLCAREEGTGQQNALTQVMEVLQEEIPSSEVIWQETSYADDVNLQRQDVGADTTISYNGWEEEEEEEMSYEDQQYFETNLDWIIDIARPRSYWEDLRQAWYQEVFNTKSQDEEIRQLLERGSVSAVLASDFRERMDRLVMCSVQRTLHLSVIEEDVVEEDRSMRAFLEQNMPSFNHHPEEDREEEEQPDQEHVQEEHIEQEEHNREEEDEQENEEVSSSMQQQQYHDVSDYYDQNSSSSHLPWDHQYHDHEGISVDSDHAASTSLQQPSPLHSYDRDTQGGSSFKNSSIEMELIYDLRSHMEQIYSEMSELRKSVTSCVDMQMKLQHSIREEVSAAIITDRMDRKDSNRRQQKKGNCCICYEKKVDSLLYRCGHMCTCFKCANELQWSSGQCPICRAQIVDVVRA